VPFYGGGMKLLALVVLAITHNVHGCHVWQAGARTVGPSTKLTLAPGANVQIRVSCPMDFTVTELRGPRLALGDPVFHSGTVRTIRFARRGVYVLEARNVQSSTQQGLQTLGPDNALRLTVTVR
jgi:hypothetical protein